jgi:aspartyl protease family protein
MSYPRHEVLAAMSWKLMSRHSMVLAVAVTVSLASAKAMAHYTGLDASAVARSAPAPLALAPAAIFKSRDGHYWAATEVDGHWIHCLVDTGATTMALTTSDAARLGLHPAALHYTLSVNTAAGPTWAAPVQLARVSVAGAPVDHVSALVVKAGLSSSLLGMSYLGRLSKFEATPQTLILSR